MAEGAARGADERQPGGESKFRTTVTLTEEELTSLDELRLHFRRVEKRKVDQSQLIREAIRHYHGDILPRDGRHPALDGEGGARATEGGR